MNRVVNFILLMVLSAVSAGFAAAATCDVSANGVAFGAYDSIGNAQRDTSGTISVTCSGTLGDNVSYSIQLNAGAGTYANRRISTGAVNLNYNLYVDSSRSQIWGDGSGGTSVVHDSYALTQTSVTRQYTIYGRIPTGQNQANAGSYLENIIVTLSY